LRRTIRSLAIAVLLVSGFASCSDDGGADAPSVDPDDAAGVVAAVYKTFDGADTSLQAYAGTPVVLNFFQSYCAPCVTEMPDFEEVHQDLGDEVTFVGIAVQDRLEDAQEIVDRTGVTYELGRDPDGSLLQAAGGLVLPTTVLIRSDGTVVEVRSGAVSKGTLRDLIRDKLGVG
jgi:cytochrome c biogenesis protein CcmG/thiol:disulfide interchange protein DsbE